MNFIRKLWLKIKFLFSKKHLPEEIFISEQKTILQSSLNELELSDDYFKFTDVASRSLIIEQLAEKSTAKKILDLYDVNNGFISEKSNHNYLTNLRTELLELERRRLSLNFNNSEITKVIYPNLSFIDDKIQVLLGLISRRINEPSKYYDIRSFEDSQPNEKLNNLLKTTSTIKLHQKRLDKNRQQIEIEKSIIKQRLNQLEGAIAQNRLSDAKALILVLSLTIKQNFFKETWSCYI